MTRITIAGLFISFTFTLNVSPRLRAEEYELDTDRAPATDYFDRWMYPFNITPGTRIQAPTFGAIGSEGFDDRDGQFLLAINTDALGIPLGNPASSYRIDSARLTLTEGVGGYRYDPSYDAYTTYLDPSESIAEMDSDPGRPIELYGVGFRNEFNRFGWSDGAASSEAPVFSAGSPFGETNRATRSVFAADATGSDVSNNVDSLNQGVNGFDPTPFAIGAMQDVSGTALEPGHLVPAGATVEFEIDLSDSAIVAYLQNSLAVGQLGFAITSLNSTGEQGIGDRFVNLATSNHFAVAGPRFEISVTIDDSTIAGDFDNDGILGRLDIDALSAAISSNSSDPAFDINGSESVDVGDLIDWIGEAFGSFVGDANLDGEFNSGDLVQAFVAGEYEDGVELNSTWSTGDWNADREFDTRDFVDAFRNGGYEVGPRAAAMPVPEPTTHTLIVFALLVPGVTRRLSPHFRRRCPARGVG